MILIWDVMWNVMWSHDNYETVANPMVYSEKKFPIYRIVVYTTGIVMSAFVFGFEVLMPEKVRYAEQYSYTSKAFVDCVLHQPEFPFALLCELPCSTVGRNKSLIP